MDTLFVFFFYIFFLQNTVVLFVVGPLSCVKAIESLKFTSLLGLCIYGACFQKMIVFGLSLPIKYIYIRQSYIYSLSLIGILFFSTFFFYFFLAKHTGAFALITVLLFFGGVNCGGTENAPAASVSVF